MAANLQQAGLKTAVMLTLGWGSRPDRQALEPRPLQACLLHQTGSERVCWATLCSLIDQPAQAQLPSHRKRHTHTHTHTHSHTHTHTLKLHTDARAHICTGCCTKHPLVLFPSNPCATSSVSRRLKLCTHCYALQRRIHGRRSFKRTG